MQCPIENHIMWQAICKKNFLIITIAVVYATKAVAKRKPEKSSSLNGIRTHDLSDTGAVLYFVLEVLRLALGYINGCYTDYILKRNELLVTFGRSRGNFQN